MKDSSKTQPLFDLACEQIMDAMKTGVVVDRDGMDVALKAFLGHIKVRNIEVKESSLRFMVQRNMAETTKELKKLLPKVLPEYAKA